MAYITTAQSFPNVTLAITDAAGNPAGVDGVPVWASSDETVLSVVAGADGMSAVVSSLPPGTARIPVSADADLTTGVVPITGVSEDVNVTAAAAPLAANLTLTLGAPADK